MATLYSSTVDPGGTGDYTSLANADRDFFGATSIDLEGNDEYIECECICTNGNADTTTVDLTYSGNPSTNYIEIIVPAAYRHNGTWPTSGNIYRLDVTDDQTLNIESGTEVYITGVANRRKYTSIQYNSVIYIKNFTSGATTAVFESCFATAEGANYCYYVSNTSTPNKISFTNCIGNGAGRELFQNGGTVASTILAYNCVAVNSTDTVGGNFLGFGYVKNCVACNNNLAVDIAVDIGMTVEYNATDDGSGSNAQTLDSSNNYENEFVDFSNGNFHLVSGSTCIGNGIGPSSDSNVPTTDFDGDSRSGTSCDIGFDEYVAASALSGVANIQGTAIASIKTLQGTAIASIKTLQGVS